MSLKSETVDAIFARMLARYGNTWIAKWQGVPMDVVKADWATELSGLERYAIVYALGFLPLEFPPTCTQFRAICARAPERTAPALPAPDRDVAKVAEVLASVRTAIAPKYFDHKGWAHDLKARDEAKTGDRLTITQRRMYREALSPEASYVA